MWISATHKARIITTEAHPNTPVIEIFRWSEETGGWVHVIDTANVEELAKIVDLALVEETSETP